MIHRNPQTVLGHIGWVFSATLEVNDARRRGRNASQSKGHLLTKEVADEGEKGSDVFITGIISVTDPFIKVNISK